MRKTYLFFGIFACLSAAAGGLSACRDDTPPQRATRESKPSQEAMHASAWLDHKSEISPAQWLASRGEDRTRPLTDEHVLRIDRDLDRAHAIFRESKRMIANRAAQLETMLNELGARETAAGILSDIVSIPGEVGQTEGFGAVTQHYYILRKGPTERGSALAILKDRYGTRSGVAGANP